MDKATLQEVEQWMLKAKHDLKSATLLLNDDDPIRDTGVYHCQQAVEKQLKAYLTSKDTADILTPYAVAFRYSGDAWEPTEGQMRRVLLVCC